MESLNLESYSDQDTKKIAALLARECARAEAGKHALIIGLVGELGAGKTAFAQGFAAGLGVRERVISPTFVLLKIFKLPRAKKFKRLIHIDAYRLDKPRELPAIGWDEFAADPQNIILVEWADKVSRLMPQGSIVIKFAHGGGNKRKINVSQK